MELKGVFKYCLKQQVNSVLEIESVRIDMEAPYHTIFDGVNTGNTIKNRVSCPALSAEAGKFRARAGVSAERQSDP